MKFKKTVEITEEKITIKISCEKQVYSSEDRIVFKENIQDSIPKEYLEKVKLTAWPDKLVSNINRKKYTNVGIWEYSILKEEKKESPKKAPATRNKIKPLAKIK